jgi:hypothetical protein
MRIHKLAGFTRNAVALVLLTGALIAATPAYFAPQGYIAEAACTKVGRASIDPDGVPRCDCTINESSGNCSCIITCPKEGTDAEIESGGAS